MIAGAELTRDDRRVDGASSRFVRTLPGRAGAALSFVGWLYLSISLFLYAWIIGTQLLMGWHPLLVSSGSMSPSIRTGDVVMIGEQPPGGLGQQTVILFDDPNAAGRTVLHRVVSVRADGAYATKGDANADIDLSPVRPDQIQGIGRMVIPAVGAPFVWLQAGQTAKVAVWIGSSLVAVWFAFRRPRRTATAASEVTS